jgi:hypothetical protein
LRKYRKSRKYREYQSEYKETHKQQKSDYIKFWNIKRKYNISKTDYLLLLKKQNHNCAICGFLLSSDSRQIHIDHSHKSGKIRGIIHQDCNLLLGFSN